MQKGTACAARGKTRSWHQGMPGFRSSRSRRAEQEDAPLQHAHQEAGSHTLHDSPLGPLGNRGVLCVFQVDTSLNNFTLLGVAWLVVLGGTGSGRTTDSRRENLDTHHSPPPAAAGEEAEGAEIRPSAFLGTLGIILQYCNGIHTILCN